MYAALVCAPHGAHGRCMFFCDAARSAMLSVVSTSAAGSTSRTLRRACLHLFGGTLPGCKCSGRQNHCVLDGLYVMLLLQVSAVRLAADRHWASSCRCGFHWTGRLQGEPGAGGKVPDPLQARPPAARCLRGGLICPLTLVCLILDLCGLI